MRGHVHARAHPYSSGLGVAACLGWAWWDWGVAGMYTCVPAESACGGVARKGRELEGDLGGRVSRRLPLRKHGSLCTSWGWRRGGRGWCGRPVCTATCLEIYSARMWTGWTLS